ncbi:hypothetical protein [Paenibacillus sp. GXUN7292]|uniref:hypothetical protein n=1 Tax=Paenibacillus sp. GXUN7292 TaxID=3422499 RepID=UPI003D7C8F76
MEQHNHNEHNKKPYYVSVHAMQILADPKAADYELEIIASEQEVMQLKELFDEMYHSDNGIALTSFLTFFESTPSSELMDDYDRIIKEIYSKLYEHGTDETRQHIESMNIL